MAISEGDRHDAYLRRIQPPVLDMDGVAAMLRRRMRLIAGVTLACVTVSLVYVLLATPKYTAFGRIELGGQIAGEVASTQIKDITSPRVFNNVIAREKLNDDPLFGARSRGILPALLIGVGLVPAADPHALALRQLERAVSVTRESGSSTADIKVVTPAPETSARVANAVMDAYLEDVSRAPVEPAASVSASPDASLEALKSRLREAEQRYHAYREESGSNRRPAPEKQIGELSDQVTAAEARVASLRSALSQLQRARKDGDLEAIPPALRSRAVDALRSRYVTARRIEADVSETLGPRHPDLRFARQQLTEARRSLDQAVADIIQSTSGELERARSATTRLKTRLEASKKDLAASNDTSTRLRELEQDVEASRAAYQAILLKSQSIGDKPQSGELFPRIVSRATPPLKRDGGSPLRVLLISFVLGLGLAMSLAWLLELAREQQARPRFNS